jgi:hypothetical protein
MTAARAVSICLALCIACHGCARGGAACAGPTCGTGYECLANRCAIAGGVPVPRDSERFVLSPIDLAIATPTPARESSATAVTLGSARGGDAIVYARFGSTYKGRTEIAAAFLLLTVSEGTEPLADDVPLEVWTLATSWSSESVSRGTRPRLSRPMARGIARTSPPSLVRVDVTPLVRELARTPADDGIGIDATGSHGAGVTFSTARAGAPRLEVYLTPPRRTAGAW